MNASRPTMLDVAKLANVSVGTVSRVVNNHPSVQEKNRRRVQQAMEQLNFVPNHVAQSMRTNSTKTIGCMVPNMSSAFFSQIAAAAEETLYREGFTLTVTNTREIPEREVEVLAFYQSRRVDGVIASISDERDPRILASLKGLTIPVVLVQRRVAAPINSVVTNHYDGMCQCTDYLFALGHQRILAILSTESTYPAQQSVKAFIDNYRKHGVAQDESLIQFCGLAQDEAYRVTHRIMMGKNRPTAIIAGSYQTTGVLRALAALSLEIPKDVSVISLGETEVTELYHPALTVLRWDNAELGRVAAQILLDELALRTHGAPTEIVMPVELVVRRSCAPVRRTEAV